MADWQQITIETYNNSATELAEYFAGIGPRTEDIDRAIKFSGNSTDPKVLELGCGDGRDALEITARTPNYTGIDPSVEMIKIAQDKVKVGEFVVSGAVEYDFPENLDVIFAFASLLHLDQDDVKTVLGKANDALKPDGIFYVSLKHRNRYSESVNTDRFGQRKFYYYYPGLIEELAQPDFRSIYQDYQRMNNTSWFTMALEKAG